jgi:chemotaxis-related protein WspD
MLSRQPVPLENSLAEEIRPCWSEIGEQGDASCPELPKHVLCRNCPVYSRAAVQLLDRPVLPEFRRERTEHYAQPKQLTAPAKTSALLFRIRTDWLALPTQAFQEVAEHRPVHSLPHRRRSIVLGLVNIRGELLICVSLGHLLGLEPTRSGPPLRRTYERLLVANWKGNRLVFPADEVRGVHRFQRLELQEPPATLASSNLGHTQGLLFWQGRTVGLLDADRLFATLNRSLT